MRLATTGVDEYNSKVAPKQLPARRSLSDLSDQELDRYILTRLTIVGVDLSVLPVEDERAPVDQMRVLRAARSFLRSTVSEISALEISPADAPPILYPAALAPRLGRVLDGG